MITRENQSGPNGPGPSLSEGGQRSREGATLHREAMSKATPTVCAPSKPVRPCLPR